MNSLPTCTMAMLASLVACSAAPLDVDAYSQAESAMTAVSERDALGTASAEPLAVPEEFVDFISHTMITDAVRDKFGHLYDRKSITRWLAARATSPVTREGELVGDLVPAVDVQERIDAWVAAQPLIAPYGDLLRFGLGVEDLVTELSRYAGGPPKGFPTLESYLRVLPILRSEPSLVRGGPQLVKRSAHRVSDPFSPYFVRTYAQLSERITGADLIGRDDAFLLRVVGNLHYCSLFRFCSLEGLGGADEASVMGRQNLESFRSVLQGTAFGLHPDNIFAADRETLDLVFDRASTATDTCHAAYRVEEPKPPRAALTNAHYTACLYYFLGLRPEQFRRLVANRALVREALWANVVAETSIVDELPELTWLNKRKLRQWQGLLIEGLTANEIIAEPSRRLERRMIDAQKPCSDDVCPSPSFWWR